MSAASLPSFASDDLSTRLAALSAKATPGPWRHKGEDGRFLADESDWRAEITDRRPEGGMSSMLPILAGHETVCLVVSEGHDDEPLEADAELIVTVINAVREGRISLISSCGSSFQQAIEDAWRSGYRARKDETDRYWRDDKCEPEGEDALWEKSTTRLVPAPTEAARGLDVTEEIKLEWHEGYPTAPWADEWFIAETTYGDKVVLRSLPAEWSYDFKTADETYIKADRIRRWMQFPDSEYIVPEAALRTSPPETVGGGAKFHVTEEGLDRAFARMCEHDGGGWDRMHLKQAIELAVGTALSSVPPAEGTWQAIETGEASNAQRD